MHLGSKRGAPVTFPATLILAHMRLALRRKWSSADSRQAYYRVCWELCMGRIHEDMAVGKIFQHFGIPPEDMQVLHEEVRNGGTMPDGGIPAEIRHAVKDFHHVAWFSTSYGSGRRI